MLEGTGELGRISGQVDEVRKTISDMRIAMAMATVRHDYLERDAIDGDDLDKLEAKIMAAVGDQMTQANAQQSRDILGEVKNLFDAYRAAQKDEQLASQAALLGAIKDRRSRLWWWVLGIVGGLIVSVGSVLFGVWIAGLMEHQA